MRYVIEHRLALPSPAFGLLAGVVTTVHRLHAARVMHSSGPCLHVVWTEIVLPPGTLVSMHVVLRDGNAHALRAHPFIASLGFVGPGPYEGGWTTPRRSSATCGIGDAGMDIRSMLPAGAPHARFHELTGVATSATSMPASAHTLRFAFAAREMQRR